MENLLLSRVQQTSSRVKNVIEDSEKLLAELKARRTATEVNNQPVVLQDDQDDQEYEADDESENNEGSNESDEIDQLELEDENSDDENEEYTYSFFCCTTRRGVHMLLL